MYQDIMLKSEGGSKGVSEGVRALSTLNENLVFMANFFVNQVHPNI